jgi:5-methylcytosine-specific restriction endonuclease McrA
MAQEKALKNEFDDLDLSFLDDIQTLEIDLSFLDMEGAHSHRGQMGYRKWRLAVFTRDNFICQKCGHQLPAEELEAHHVKPFSVAPELMYDVDNGLTLCHDCHIKTDSYGRKTGYV